jgi:hypothetical protein
MRPILPYKYFQRNCSVYIFHVKCLACPLDILTNESQLKSFVASTVIGLIYQYFLSYRELASYLLNSDYQRVTFIDNNKEGIFSCFGYLAISLATDAVCYRLKEIVNQR